MRSLLRLRRVPIVVAGFVAVGLSGCSLGQTDPATYLSDHSVTLNGRVSSTENADNTYADDHHVDYWFKYGPTTDYGSETPHETLTLPDHDFKQEFPVSQPLGGLDAETTYHFQLCAQDAQEGVGPGCTGDQMFTTEDGHDPGPDLTFTSGRNVWTIDADGSNAAQATSSSYHASFSPDGRQLVYTKSDNPSGGGGIWTATAAGANPVQVTSGDYPAWSPDGTRIAYENGSALRTVSPDGSTDTLVYQAPDRTDIYGSGWSPDGGRLCFTVYTHPNAGGRPVGASLWVVNADGSDPNQATTDIGSGTWRCSWTPDGQRLLYVAASHNAATIKPDGTEFSEFPGPLTVNRLSESPDGSHLAWEAYSNGSSSIDVANGDGSNPVQVSGGTDPIWSPRFSSAAAQSRAKRRKAAKPGRAR